MEGGGFEPPKLSRQIYSLIPLAARESRLQLAKLFLSFFQSPPLEGDHLERTFLRPDQP